MPVVASSLRRVESASRLSRLEWATLLKRIYNIDALACPTCDGRLDFVAVITEPEPIHNILDHLGLPSAERVNENETAQVNI
jgi:hypothetical protein